MDWQISKAAGVGVWILIGKMDKKPLGNLPMNLKTLVKAWQMI